MVGLLIPSATTSGWIALPSSYCNCGWLGSRAVSVLDSGADIGPGFKSQSRRCRVTVLGKLLTPIVPLFTEQRNWQQPARSLRRPRFPLSLLAPTALGSHVIPLQISAHDHPEVKEVQIWPRFAENSRQNSLW